MVADEFGSAKPRRGKGEGGLFPFELRGRTRYRATQVETVPFTDVDGVAKTKKKLITGTGDSAREARSRLQENVRKFHLLSVEQQARNRRNPDTVSSYYYDTWLKSKRAKDWRSHVLRGVRQRIEQHVLPDLGSIPLNLLQRDELRTLFDIKLRAKSLSEATLVNVWRNLHTMLGDAVYDGKLSRNPMDLIRKSDRPHKKPPTPFDIPPDLVSTVMLKVRDTPEEPLRMVSLTLGLRIAELLGLTWDRVHMEDGMRVLQIFQQLKPIDIPHGEGCRRDLTTGKFSCGKSPQNCPRHTTPPTSTGLAIFPYVKTRPRTVALFEPLLSLLKQQKERQDEWRAKPEWDPIPRAGMNNLVFTTQTGRPLRQQAVGAEWRKLLTDCGFTALTQHKSRHIAITAMILNNTPLSVIGSIVGHADSRVTEQVYAQVGERDQIAHLERIGKKYDKDAMEREREKTEKEWRDARAGMLAEQRKQSTILHAARMNTVERVKQELAAEGRNEESRRLNDIVTDVWTEEDKETAWKNAVLFARENGFDLAVKDEELAETTSRVSLAVEEQESLLLGARQ